ncbi:MAG: glycosyltransferase, partial [Armatimonadota bacterium]
FGLIALESLACGVPVLATPAGAIPEVMNNFEPRWLAEAASAEAIASLLAAFLKGDLPSHRPEELRTRAQTLYDQERVLPRLLAATVFAKEA